MNNTKNKWLVPVAFSNIYVIWGLTFIAISFGLSGFPPFILSGLRFLVAGLLIFSHLTIKGKKADSLINWRKKWYHWNTYSYRRHRTGRLGRTICYSP